MKVKVTKMPANLAGETLRSLSFATANESELGCYDCFDMKEGFEKADLDEELLRILGGSIIDEYVDERELVKRSAQAYHNKEHNITCAWLWDGDGHLVFRVDGRILENTDCKKDYTWKWIK